MAKKLSIGKIVLIGVGVVITLGSASALLHGRDEKEDEHVHDFGTSLVCECGEHKQELLVSEVEVGMNLAGYTLEIINEGNFNKYLNNTGGFLEDTFYISFSDGGAEFNGLMSYPEIVCQLSDVVANSYETGSLVSKSLYSWGSDGVVSHDKVVIPSSWGVVSNFSDAKSAAYFKLVYVGEAAPVSYTLPKGEAVREETTAQETEDFGLVNELPDETELWSEIY